MIYIVDDLSDIVNVLGDMIRSKGYRTTGFTNPKEFLAHLGKTEKSIDDIFLIDICMPKMSGFKVVESLLEYNPQLGNNVIFMTANISLFEGSEFEIFHFISKPFSIDGLHKEIKCIESDIEQAKAISQRSSSPKEEPRVTGLM